MRSESGYRIAVIGTDAELELLKTATGSAPERFHVEMLQSAAGVPNLHSPDVSVIGGLVERPLPMAQQLRALYPTSQIVFLVPPERLELFRKGLPFVPNLASAWTESSAAESSQLGGLITEAARVSRERSATAAVIGRINQQLGPRAAAPDDLRRSQLALSERYLATILTQSPDAFIAVDRSGGVVAYNDAAGSLFAHALENRTQAPAADLFPEEEQARLGDLLAMAYRGEIFSGIEVQLVSPDRSRSHAELSLAPVHDESGSIVSLSITARDITERKRAEVRQRLLINELNHRVKNTLAIVQALAHQSFKGKATAEEERRAFEARLTTLAAAHNLLTQETWTSVRLAQIVAAAVGAACGANASRHRMEGPDVLLAPQTAVSLAMAIHELCTNAIKYGALSNEIGAITTRWKTYDESGDQRLRLEWIECGGPPVDPPKRRGFGTKMIERGLASELNGQVQLDFRSEGLVCLIDAPLPRVED